ncbi:hypothetical protein BGZ67_002807 [Mortierella alpina]|nr:hypothetical protein BGZ67_002807 [Mortierella alpina]
MMMTVLSKSLILGVVSITLLVGSIVSGAVIRHNDVANKRAGDYPCLLCGFGDRIRRGDYFMFVKTIFLKVQNLVMIVLPKAHAV